MDDHPNFGHFLPIGIFLIGVVKGRYNQTSTAFILKRPVVVIVPLTADALVLLSRTAVLAELKSHSYKLAL